MEHILIFPAGSTDALAFAAKILSANKIPLVDHPTPEVTHLLLDIPSFGPEGLLRSGERPEAVLERLPPGITVIGGMLDQPSLEGYPAADLLKDEWYLAGNASITADCALQTAAPLLKTTFADTPTLIIGWGRIGKCLGQMLKALGCRVTIAARREQDRSMLEALGYESVDIPQFRNSLPQMRLIFNTVPKMVLGEADLGLCPGCVKIDLASKPGLAGPDVIYARGLPGILAPESSGRLIAETVLRYLKEGKP